MIVKRPEFVRLFSKPHRTHLSAVAMKPSEDAGKGKMVSMAKLFQYADTTDKLLMAIGSIAGAATGVSQPLQIVIFGDMMNAFNIPPPSIDSSGNAPSAEANLLAQAAFRHQINVVALRFVWLGIAVLFTGLLQVACWSIAAARQARRLREEYSKAILRQEIGWFDVNDPMTLATKVADQTLTIQEGMGKKVGEGVNFFSMAVGGILIGVIKGWKLGLALLCFTPLLACAAYFMVRTLTGAIQSSIEAYGRAGAVAEEALGNVRTVQVFNMMQRFQDKYTDYLKLAEQAGIKKGLAVGLGTGAMFGCMLCTYSFGMYYGSVLVAGDQLGEKKCTGSGCYDGGRVMTVFSCIIMGAMGLGQSGPSLQAVFSARAAAYDVFRVIDRVSKIDATSTNGLKLEQVAGEIEIKNVSFRYPSRTEVPVCENYSLRIRAGETIAFVGPSGSGKSTIISLIERFYDPDVGDVLLDGHNLKNLNVGWLREHIGLVGQEPILFADSIFANIAHGKPGSSEEEVIQAAKLANAFAFISSFPQGFRTEVGERGLQLSGGQKQRIAIARAILKNPPILLLDEATSALDTESERIVQASLDALVTARKRTTVIIAHRLSTIRDADRIVVISAGRVIEDGPHDTLMQLPDGHYRMLVEAQSRRGDEESGDDALVQEMDNPGEDQLGAIESARGKGDPSLHPEPRESVSTFVSSLPSRYMSGDIRSSFTTAAITKTASPREDIQGPLVNSAGRSKAKYGAKIHPLTEKTSSSTTPRGVVAASPKVSSSRVWKLTLPDWKFLVLGMLGGGVNGATFPVWGVLMTKIVVLFYDFTLTADGMKDKGSYWAVAYFILAMTFAVSIILQNYSFAIVSERLTTRVRRQVFHAMLHQDIGWFDLDANSSGALTTRLAVDCATLQGMTSESLNRSFVTLMTLATGFTIAFYHSWKMTLVMLAIFPLLGAASFIQAKMLMGGSAKHSQNGSDTKAGALLSEAISGIRTVASFHLEDFVTRQYIAYLTLSNNTDVRAGFMGGAAFGLAQGVIFCACAFLFWYGGKLVSSGEIRFEDMFMVIICIMFSSMGLGVTSQGVADTKKIQEAVQRVFATLDRAPAINLRSQDSKKTLDVVKGDIELQNVRFAYPNRPETAIYKNYSLKIPSGKTVALVGASGCGKSTAIALIERFYDPLQGRVLLDGHDIKDLNLKWLRSQVSLVSQEPVLFVGTIADNIASGKPGCTREVVERAAQMANAHDFILQFPAQYDTNVGDRGTQLSGGQKQRIAIARAILRDPAVLLLDEATSALDNESERIVQESLDRLLTLKKRTTIVVAHRLTTIRNADLIAVAHGGGIVELGTHNELMQLPDGIYRGLVQTQQQRSTADEA
ncbi:hypothetical protein Poli38472_005311 [Pythium oligandrum]|uniref:Uncharacterized protein n=1 Tax=Pythium oligandrum TaxID=41045 RepID=A0A8K1CHQ8_PYTOL|nr:hypothetical protein Poli38472_005311 [Pythium oligandrum]|eukprot:TMW62693.1 hypothetical protein Poli38472_005311 [Pythium oligandrum]